MPRKITSTVMETATSPLTNKSRLGKLHLLSEVVW